MNGNVPDTSLLTELILIWGSGCYKYLAPNGAKPSIP